MTQTRKNTIGVALIALIIGISIGYAGAGMFLRPILSQNIPGGYTGGTGMMRGGARGGAGSAGGFLTGTVVKKDQSSMTLNTRDGNSHLVFITPDTSVSKSVQGTLSDVSVGATVIVSGTTNSDGSVSASLLQLRPAATATP